MRGVSVSENEVRDIIEEANKVVKILKRCGVRARIMSKG